MMIIYGLYTLQYPMPLIRVAGTCMALRLGGLLYVLAMAPSRFDVVAVGFWRQPG